jgi:glutathione S-transferase
MDMHLARHDFFVAGHFTIADIALYAYTHVAEQCDFDLGRYPAVRRWLDRIGSEPGYVPMDWQAEPLTAAE